MISVLQQGWCLNIFRNDQTHGSASKSKGNDGHWTSWRLRTPYGFTQMYRAMSVLGCHVQDVLGGVFLIAQIFYLVFLTLTLFLGVRKGTDFNTRFVLLFSCSLNFFLYFMITKMAGKVFENSQRLLSYWRRKEGTNGLLYNKYLRSLRPIRVKVGHFCYCDDEFLASSIKFIFETLVDLLLSTPNWDLGISMNFWGLDLDPSIQRQQQVHFANNYANFAKW